MSEPYLSEIKIVSFPFAPRGWAFCNGQQLPIHQNEPLFGLLGTKYGGNGTSTFALPNLQGKVPIHMGAGFTLGQAGGEVVHTLNGGEMPAHTHVVTGSSADPTQASADGNVWAKSNANPYAPNANHSMDARCIGPAGGSEPHANMSPYLALGFVIALEGILPSRA